jgi:CubicO group peptidase (beta-lactamase class C family)
MKPMPLSRRAVMKASLVGTIGISVASACTSPPEGITDAVDGIMNEQIAKFSIPGAAVGILRQGRIAWSKGYGWANVKEKSPMTPTTIMNIASISKTVTATAVMQLWERGLIDLDANINGYLPFDVANPRYPAAAITTRRLLNHLSSIRDGKLFWDNNYHCGNPPTPLGNFLASYLEPEGVYYDAEDNFYDWPPGALKPDEHVYCNAGYALLGYIVERRTGTPFTDYCAKNILEPLGMSSTGWYLHDVDAARHAIPYSKVTHETLDMAQRSFSSILPAPEFSIAELVLDSYMPNCLYSFESYPDGMLRTSVDDLALFLSSYATRDGFQVLKESTIELMLSDRSDGRSLCWGKTILENGDVVWGHSGGDPGVSTYMGFRKRDGVGVIFFFNCDDTGDEEDLLRALFRTQQ